MSDRGPFHSPALNALSPGEIRSRDQATFARGAQPRPVIPAGTPTFQINEFGSLGIGWNLLGQDIDAATYQTGVYDFAVSVKNGRWLSRSGRFAEVDDPCDINATRFGAGVDSTPYGPRGQEGDNSLLTAPASGTGFQIRYTPATAPYLGDNNTPGAKALNSSALIDYLTTEQPRDITGAQVLAQGTKIALWATRKGYMDPERFIDFSPEAGIRMGVGAILSTPITDLVQIRGDAGLNSKHTIATTGVVTGGDITLRLFDPTTPTDGYPATYDVTIPWNATAAQAQTAVAAAAPFVGNVLATGGPWPGTPIVLEFINALALTKITRSRILTNNLTGGGNATCTHTQVGRASDVGRRLLNIRDASTGTRTQDYAIIQDGAGGTVWRINNNKAMQVAGALDHDGSSVGFMGATPVAKRTLGNAATDLASVIVLANNLRQGQIDLGLGQT